MNIDWSKAPEGATHCLPESREGHECWVKVDRGLYWFWMPHMSHWGPYDGPVITLIDLIARPFVDDKEQTHQEIIDLAATRCGIAGDSIRQLATVLAAEGYRKFEIVEENV